VGGFLDLRNDTTPDAGQRGV
jgi:arylsulfatase B